MRVQSATVTFSRDAHLYRASVSAHVGRGILDTVLANNQFGARTPSDYPAEPVRLRWPPATPAPPRRL